MSGEDLIERIKAFYAAGNKPAVVSRQVALAPQRVSLTCIHLREPTGETVGCQTCKGNVQVKLFSCAVHGTCTLGKRIEGHGCCDAKCAEREYPSTDIAG